MVTELCHEVRWGIAVIHRAIELGIDLLDTADMYGPFTHETLRPAGGGLGSGFLTGCFQKVEDMPENDFRRHNARFRGDKSTVHR